MKRRTFLEVALVLGAGLAVGGRAGLAWSRAEGFPGMRVRLEGLDSLRSHARLQVVDACEVERPLLDVPLAEAPVEWRIPSLRRGLADAVHELEARVLDGAGRVVARTESPLTVRFRAFRFSA